MKRFLRPDSLAAALLTVAGCPVPAIGCSEDTPVDAVDSGGARTQPTATAPQRELTADFLVGQWCLRSTGPMGSGENPNVDWRFRPDGSLTYQTSTDLPSHDDGSWNLEDGKLVLDARPIWGPVLIREISPNALVINQTLDYRLERGVSVLRGIVCPICSASALNELAR